MNSIRIKKALSAIALLLLTGCVVVPANYQYQRSSAVYQYQDYYYNSGGYYRYNYDPTIQFVFRVGGGYRGYHRW